jgi:hypothetical protein
MPRRPHQKRQTKTTEPVHQQQSRELSPIAQVIAQCMANGSEEYLKQNLIRTMTDSARLAKEPEFRDLYRWRESSADNRALVEKLRQTLGSSREKKCR